MNGSASQAALRQSSASTHPWIVTALVVLAGVLTVVTTIVGNGNVVVALAPLVLFAALAVMWFAPLQLTVFIVMFFYMAMDALNEGPWNSPVSGIGALLAHNLNQSLPIPALSISGAALLLLYLLIVHVGRCLARVPTAAPDQYRPAKPMLGAMGVSLLTVFALIIYGRLSGGDVQMAKIQVQMFVLILLVAYLLATNLHGRRDFRIACNLIVAAACIKAVLANWVVSIVAPSGAEYATTHGDSVIFACAFTILVARLAEQYTRRNMWVCVLLLPLLVSGMVANDRRIVWAELAAGLGAIFAAGHGRRLKRSVVRTLLILLPVIAAYFAAGWNSEAKIFEPVRTVRSMGDSEVDSSTLYRELENYNLLHMLRSQMLIGPGFGHPFVETVRTPDISFFKEYRYLPHNSILGLWAFTGMVGFTGLFASFVVGVYLVARGYQRSTNGDERAAALTAIATIIIYLFHAWGDIGFTERLAIFPVGLALAICAQLGRANGAWGAVRVQSRSQGPLSVAAGGRA